MKIAIIGAGISGLSTAHFLNERHNVSIFEKEDSPGGLIRCKRVSGSLFHTCGGHVFNSKRQDVLDWFWGKFVKEDEFTCADRNACVFLDKDPKLVPYPIENYIYLFDRDFQKNFYKDLDEIDQQKGGCPKITDYENFGDFLRWRFGKTLYDLYFEPYNKKVWKRNLSTVPMSWMEGKLPMPTTQEMRDNNKSKVVEKSFVHSTFWYEKDNGSQYIADKLAEGLNIKYNSEIKSLKRVNNKWIVCGESFDRIVFCGNIKDMVRMIEGISIESFHTEIEALEYHGTTAVFCEIDANPYSWVYLPSTNYDSHRIICTGNFASSNNSIAISKDRITGTIEFTDYISKEAIIKNLNIIPLNPSYIDHVYNKFSYPIQSAHTRELIKELKQVLAPLGFYFTGRFADWEYYNMDIAIGAAMDMCKTI